MNSSFYMRANKNLCFCSIMRYKLYSKKKKNHVSIFTDGLICLIDWIHKAKLYQIPQDDSVRFGGASTVATEHDAAQIFF